MRKQNKTIYNSWYSLKYGHQLQQSYYNFFVVKKGGDIEILKEAIDDFALNFLKQKKDHLDKRHVLEMSSTNEGFDYLINYIKDKAGIEFKKNTHKKKRQRRGTYDDWWQRSNLDGSFAYSGVTDDF